MASYILAIDQGTTSTRAILFDAQRRITAIDQQEFPQYFPRSGWVEQDPEEIWASVVAVCRGVLNKAGVRAHEIAAIGITNQRETTVVWDRATGRPIHRAIVWQDRRTANFCEHLKSAGHEDLVAEKTGLLLDPYFSSTKVAWVLDNVPGAGAAAESGALAFGTIDSFLLWRLTGGKVHATDPTNASRTLLYDIHDLRFCPTLLDLFKIPQSMLPEVRECAADFGIATEDFLGAEIPILGIAGDQQAAMIGQACFQPGMVKSTYGTGCFALLNTGENAVRSKNRLLTTLAYIIDGKPAYALEGSIFVAGAAVQWLRDGIQIISQADETDALASAAQEMDEVYFVPAFVGLGAPYWDSHCRGAIYGLTRSVGRNEIARAALEAVCFQTADLLDAMRKDWSSERDTILRVDGGMVGSDWTMQRLADLLASPVDRPEVMETTALGAAYLAGLRAGLYPPPDAFAEAWRLNRRFAPQLTAEERNRKRAGWRDAVQRTLTRR